MLPGPELVIAMLAVFAGSLVQGTIGIGLGMVIVPVFMLTTPSALPAVPLLLALPLTTSIALRDRRAVDRIGIPQLLLGRLIGTIIAAWLLTVVTSRSLSLLFALVILAVVALSATSAQVPMSSSVRLIAGTTSGLFSTTAAIGGPPLALLYQRRPGPELRSTIGVVSLVGALMSLGGLTFAGRLGQAHLVLAVILAPAMLLGFGTSRRLITVLEARWLRPAVLAFAAVSALITIGRVLF